MKQIYGEQFMNNIIKTIGDIHPEEYYVTSKQYKTIKNKKTNVPSIIFYRYVVKLSYQLLGGMII